MATALRNKTQTIHQESMLESFTNSLETIWNCPEVQPLSTLENLPYIFSCLESICEGNIPEPIVSTEDGEVTIKWREGGKMVVIFIDPETLDAEFGWGDIYKMNPQSYTIDLGDYTNWQIIKRDIINEMGCQNLI